MKRTKPLEITKQSPKTLMGIRNEIVLLRAAVKTKTATSAILKKMTTEIYKRFGIEVNIKSTAKDTYISANYVGKLADAFKINMFSLAKRDRKAVKLATKLQLVSAKLKGTVDYDRAKIHGSAVSTYTLYLNMDTLGKQSVPTAVANILRNVGFAFHMTASAIHMQRAKHILYEVAKPTFKPASSAQYVKELRDIGVITTLKSYNQILRMMSTGNKVNVSVMLLKRIKTNVLNRTPKGAGFVASFGGTKALKASLEVGKTIVKVMNLVISVWLLVMGINLLAAGIFMLHLNIGFIASLLIIFLGVFTIRIGYAALMAAMPWMDKKDSMSKLSKSAFSYIGAMRKNKVYSGIWSTVKNGFRKRSVESLEAELIIDADFETKYTAAHNQYIMG